MPQTSPRTLPQIIAIALATLFASVSPAQFAAKVLVPIGRPNNGAQALALSLKDYEAIRGEDQIEIKDFIRGNGDHITLTLQRMQIYSDDVKFVVASPAGEHEIPPPDIQCFSGEVAGDPGSRAFLALSPSGTSGTIFSRGKTSIISSGPGGTMPTMIYETDSKAASGINILSPACAGGLTPPGQDPPPPFGDELSLQSGTCRVYRMAIECDTEFTANLFAGNQTSASAYVSTLIAGMNDIYRREVNVLFNLAYVRLWVGEDPYTSANTGDQLGQFRDYWVANMGNVNRNLAHMLSARGLGGGVAWVSQVCSSYGYAVSANIAGAYPYPLVNNHWQNWDIMVFSHETGHNVGTGHTHDINSYDPIIDGCGNGDCTVANAHMGTIMSYCHTCAGGMNNIRLELGPRVATAVRTYLDSVPTCGSVPSITFTLQPHDRLVCAHGYAPFSVAVVAPPPVTYQWQRNGVNINGARSSSFIIPSAAISMAGDYTCVVTSNCVSAVSNPARLSVCIANFNCDTQVDFFDYLDFVDALSAHQISADVNADGVIDFFDYLDFVDAYSTGC